MSALKGLMTCNVTSIVSRGLVAGAQHATAAMHSASAQPAQHLGPRVTVEFIGKRHLYNAMKAVATNPRSTQPLGFTVLRIPFFLEPNYPAGEDFEESNYDRLVRKWGGASQFEAQKQRHRLKERGQEVGIQHFKLDRTASNTFASHRLVQWVTKTQGINKAEALYNELNSRHFEEGQKLNNRRMLCEAAEKVGLNGSEVAEFLSGTEGTENIVKAQQILSSMNIHSIPTFIIGGSMVASGALHASELENIFRQIESTGSGAPDSVFQEALEIPDTVMQETMRFDGGSL